MMRKNKRLFDQMRKIKIQRKFLKYAHGSCFIEAGDTKIICTANLEKRVPLFLKGSGSGWVKAEYRMLPGSSENRVSRDQISGRSIEIQRLIGRSLRSAVNLPELGEKTIWVDCDVIQADGGTRSISIVGGFIALVDCLIQQHKKNEIKSIPISNFVAATSVGLIKNNYLLDLDYSEDFQADVDLNVVMNSEGKFIEIQGTAEKGNFSKKDLTAFLQLAEKGTNELISLQKSFFKEPSFNL